MLLEKKTTCCMAYDGIWYRVYITVQCACTVIYDNIHLYIMQYIIALYIIIYSVILTIINYTWEFSIHDAIFDMPVIGICVW